MLLAAAVVIIVFGASFDAVGSVGLCCCIVTMDLFSPSTGDHVEGIIMV